MAPTPAPVSSRARLEIYKGSYVYIEPTISPRNSHRIVVKPSQEEKSNLAVYMVPNKGDKGVSMAFCFELKNKKYFPVVERESATKEISFKIQAQNEPDFSDRFLFKWTKNGTPYGSLCSVAEPSQYLHVSKKSVTLSPKPDNVFSVQILENSNNNISMLRVQSSSVGKAHKGCTRREVRRKAVQQLATRGGWTTREKKKSTF